MKLHALLAFSIVTFSATALAVEPFAKSAPPVHVDGLVAVPSSTLDRAYVRTAVNLAGYHKVMIDPVQVEFSKNWLGNMNDPRYVARLRDEDVQTIKNDVTSNVIPIFADAFRARGYEIAMAPGPDVLRLSPRVTDLYVNAPDVFPPGATRAFARDAGEATVILEARDSTNGTLLAVFSDHSTASDMQRLTRATSSTNGFWFDGLYRRWAAGSVAGLDAAKNHQGG